MPRIQFNGPPNHFLEVDGQSIPGGQSADVSAEAAAAALADPHANCSEPSSSLKSQTRPELNKLAAEIGIEEPEKLKSKDAVIAAIETHKPEAEAGEGQQTTTEEG